MGIKDVYIHIPSNSTSWTVHELLYGNIEMLEEIKLNSILVSLAYDETITNLW